MTKCTVKTCPQWSHPLKKKSNLHVSKQKYTTCGKQSTDVNANVQKCQGMWLFASFPPGKLVFHSIGIIDFPPTFVPGHSNCACVIRDAGCVTSSTAGTDEAADAQWSDTGQHRKWNWEHPSKYRQRVLWPSFFPLNWTLNWNSCWKPQHRGPVESTAKEVTQCCCVPNEQKYCLVLSQSKSSIQFKY